MPKVIELTVEVDVQKVTCPGVWLCQAGRVSLTVFALGTSYQTCLLPPIFPLLFKDVFYFRKRFQETCALNNICCLLKDETIYCELVQWSDNCDTNECVILAQYLGALNDVLFPPNMCSSDGVDLLMRRSKEFPGILSPKIEIATKVRIDEIWDQKSNLAIKGNKCQCVQVPESDGYRQKPVCHTPLYHRIKCSTNRFPTTGRSQSGESKSTCRIEPRDPKIVCGCPKPDKKDRIHSSPSPRRSSRSRGRPYSVYYVEAANSLPLYTSRGSLRVEDAKKFEENNEAADSEQSESGMIKGSLPGEERIQRMLLESRYVDDQRRQRISTPPPTPPQRQAPAPCRCEICTRYHQLFHATSKDSLTF